MKGLLAGQKHAVTEYKRTNESTLNIPKILVWQFLLLLLVRMRACDDRGPYLLGDAACALRAVTRSCYYRTLRCSHWGYPPEKQFSYHTHAYSTTKFNARAVYSGSVTVGRRFCGVFECCGHSAIPALYVVNAFAYVFAPLYKPTTINHNFTAASVEYMLHAHGSRICTNSASHSHQIRPLASRRYNAFLLL